MSAVTPEQRVSLAEAEAKAARARLGRTVDALKHRVSPQALAQDATETLKSKGVAIATDMQRNPVTVAAIAGGLVLFFARRPIAGLLRRATGTAAKSLPPESKSNEGSA